MTMSDNPTDAVDARIDGAFADFHRAMAPLAVPTDAGGKIPQAYRDYHALANARQNLNAIAEQVASAIEDVTSSDDPRLTPEVRDAIIRQNVELFDSVKQATARDLRTYAASVRAGLNTLYASKVQVAEDSSRALIRQEIEQALLANPKQTRTAVLAALVSENASRYGAELASSWGRNLMALANESEGHGAIVRHAMNLYPDTQVSANARGALQALETTQLEGLLGAISWRASQRVEAARAPKRADPHAFRPDTIRAPRS
jgi:hypothetical protein